ncbi:hypothetical protein ROT00_00205 [Agromyces mediolanus]|uniref:hypothetical protein n=1 Tax=Agromyces mediolanus TaxID=41986 RepID=UPI0038394B62
MLPLDALLGAGFILLVVGLAVATSDRFGLDTRAGLLERRDPAAASAMRRAQAVHELRGGGYGDECVGAVCTPSRRSWIDGARIRGADTDPRVEVAEEQLPPMPATVVALATATHVPSVRRPVPRTAPATTRAPADSR